MGRGDDATDAPAAGTGGGISDPEVRVPTPVPELSGGTHFPCLDAYRGIGMTMVLMNHAAYATGFIQRGVNGDGNWAEQLFGPIIARFDLSVPMFFVMSGFLLYRPFAKALVAGRGPTPTRIFYRRRVLRILPAYWVALAGIALVFGLPIVSARSWLANALLLPAVGVPAQVCNPEGACHVGYGITQAWSIGVEATYYLLLPLFAVAVARLLARRDPRTRVLGMLAACGVLYLAGTAFRLYVVAAEPSWSRQSLYWLPMFLDLFAVGMAMAVVSAALSAVGGVPGLADAAARLGAHPGWCWAVTGVIFVLVMQMQPPGEPFGLNGAEYMPRQFAYGIASAIWLWPAVFGDQSAGRLRHLLASRPLVYLGGISLSFYLWHLNIIEAVKRWTIPGYDQMTGLATFTGNYGLIVLVSWTLSFVVASVLFRLVELPFLRLKDEPLRALFRRRPAGAA